MNYKRSIVLVLLFVNNVSSLASDGNYSQKIAAAFFTVGVYAALEGVNEYKYSRKLFQENKKFKKRWVFASGICLIAGLVSIRLGHQ